MHACVCMSHWGCVHVWYLDVLGPTLAYALHQSLSIIKGMVCIVRGNEMVYFYHSDTTHRQTHVCTPTHSHHALRSRERYWKNVRGDKTRGKWSVCRYTEHKAWWKLWIEQLREHWGHTAEQKVRTTGETRLFTLRRSVHRLETLLSHLSLHMV